MTILNVLRYPDPRLHLKAIEIENIDNSIKKLVDDMVETMYKLKGLGLAATQIDVQKRLFIMDLSNEDTPSNLMIFINPQIIKKNGNTVSEEGCLSVPGIYETVNRAESIVVKYLDLDGKNQELEASGLMAICIQHEIDHLDGKVFVEYLSSLKQNFIKKKMKKLLKHA